MKSVSCLFFIACLFVLPLSAWSATLTHGPIVGRPQPHSMRVWIRSSEPTKFRIRYERKPELSLESPFVEGETSADHDNTGFVDITGLPAAKTFFYAVEIDGKIITDYFDGQKFPSFRTWASEKTFAHPELNPQGRVNSVVGVGVCNHIGGAKESAVYRTLLEKHSKQLDLFIMNGDYIYELGRKKMKPFEITTQAARDDYLAYLDGVPDMAKFFAHTPVMFQFDDHEIGPEAGTAEIGLKTSKKLRNAYTNPLLRDITLAAWTEYCGWANPPMPAHRDLLFGRATVKAGDAILTDATAQFSQVKPETTSNLHIHMHAKNGGIYAVESVLDDHHLKISPTPDHDESDASYSIGTHHYYELRKGNAHYFVLDARSERPIYHADKQRDPAQKVLGDAQLKWLLDGAQKSDAEFIIIVSPVPWTIWHNSSHVKGEAVQNAESTKEDGLIGALAERETLLNAFDEMKKPVVILSGDLHSGYGVQITDNVWEFLISPIGSGLHPQESGGKPPMQGRFDSNGRMVNIKWASTFPLAYTKEFQAQGRRHGFVYGLLHFNNIFPTGRDAQGVTLWKAYDTPTLRVEVRDTETDDVVYAETISPLDAQPLKK